MSFSGMAGFRRGGGRRVGEDCNLRPIRRSAFPGAVVLSMGPDSLAFDDPGRYYDFHPGIVTTIGLAMVDWNEAHYEII